MTASHPRRMAVFAGAGSALLLLLAACGTKPTPTVTNTTAHCDAGAACATSLVTLGNATLTVAAGASRASQTVTAELATDQKLHCPSGAGDAGAMAIFSSDAADASKTVTYTVTGTDGNAVSAAHKAHPHYLGCFGSPQAFSGYTDGRSSRAVFVSGDGLYEAAVLPCGNVDTKPCFTFAESGGTVTVTVTAGPGDPKITP